MLSDIGGFVEVAVFFPAIFLSVYARRKYLAKIFRLLPMKKERESEGLNVLQQRFKIGNSLGHKLQDSDLQCLASEAKLVYVHDTSLLKKLLIERCCYRRKKVEKTFQEKTLDSLRKQLDVRSLIATNTYLNTII